uniref:Uncharacterized protein n=1 Tax=Octopus bimaculoides TaxID=37653 RepID=A0A0L8H484_OCTBM
MTLVLCTRMYLLPNHLMYNVPKVHTHTKRVLRQLVEWTTVSDYFSSTLHH